MSHPTLWARHGNMTSLSLLHNCIQCFFTEKKTSGVFQQLCCNVVELFENKNETPLIMPINLISIVKSTETVSESFPSCSGVRFCLSNVRLSPLCVWLFIFNSHNFSVGLNYCLCVFSCHAHIIFVIS